MNIEVNRNAKVYALEEITIDTPAEKVYSVLTDINSWPEWQRNVKSAKLDGEVAEGKEFRWNAGGLKITSKLHTVQPYSEIGWTGRMLWITAVHNWWMEEQNGKCLVTVEESLEGFLVGMMKKSLKQGMIRSLKELKAAAENIK
jgi:uncharacterized protein YndB with AHSA1/START domain